MALALGSAFAITGCIIDPKTEVAAPGGDEGGDPPRFDLPGNPTTPVTPSCTQSYAADVYTPYTGAGVFPTGTVADHPWVGPSMLGNYPDGDEDFRGYTSMPTVVECASDKTRRAYVDVTDGCLDGVMVGGYTRGQLNPDSSHLFRAIALGYDAGDATHPVKWTDEGIEYRFFYSAQVGDNGFPGFKAFLRYSSEYDLYVASWRMDGTVQIQRKQCGEYAWLKILPSYGRPSPNAWHTLRFTAVGDELRLYLDGNLAIDVHDDHLAAGTAGMRIDSMDGAYIDDWKVFQP